jgi:hypothetical protein
MKDFVQLVSALTWPVLVAAALVAFCDPLSEFVRELTRRATKIKAFQFEIELPPLAEAPVDKLVTEFRELRPAGDFSSSIMALLAQLQTAGPMDYAVIDLGDGKRWLNSRLYIFAVVLQRQRGLQNFVLVNSESNGVAKRFIGIATPDSVRWALSRRSPWLERAFAMAYDQTVMSVPEAGKLILSTIGTLEDWPATQLIQNFIRQIQSTTAQSDWLQLSPTLWERAEWLNRSTVESSFGDALRRSWVTSTADRPHSGIVRAIARCSDDFVALLELGERFVSLVDRRAVLDQLVERD